MVVDDRCLLRSSTNDGAKHVGTNGLFSPGTRTVVEEAMRCEHPWSFHFRENTTLRVHRDTYARPRRWRGVGSARARSRGKHHQRDLSNCEQVTELCEDRKPKGKELLT